MVARRYHKRIHRPLGTVETFERDATVDARHRGLTIDTMTATIVSGAAVALVSQQYAAESLEFQVRFAEGGQSIVKVETTFEGDDEKIVDLYLFRTLDDGSGDVFGDYS